MYWKKQESSSTHQSIPIKFSTLWRVLKLLKILAYHRTTNIMNFLHYNIFAIIIYELIASIIFFTFWHHSIFMVEWRAVMKTTCVHVAKKWQSWRQLGCFFSVSLATLSSELSSSFSQSSKAWSVCGSITFHYVGHNQFYDLIKLQRRL